MMKRLALCFCLVFLTSSAMAANKPKNAKNANNTDASQSTTQNAQPAQTSQTTQTTQTTETMQTTQNISNYIPKSPKVTASVMKLSISQEYMTIAQKLQKAIQANQAWFMEYSKNAKPDEPLPYDAKMGITKEEYNKLIEADKNIQLVEEKKIDMTFTKTGDGKVKISTAPTSPIDKIVIDEKLGVTTSHGQLTNSTPINNQEKNSITGPWKGIQWKTETMDEGKKQAKSVKFAIGALENKNQNIVYYDVLDVDKDKKEQFSYIVFYPKS